VSVNLTECRQTCEEEHNAGQTTEEGPPEQSPSGSESVSPLCEPFSRLGTDPSQRLLGPFLPVGFSLTAPVGSSRIRTFLMDTMEFSFNKYLFFLFALVKVIIGDPRRNCVWLWGKYKKKNKFIASFVDAYVVSYVANPTTIECILRTFLPCVKKRIIVLNEPACQLTAVKEFEDLIAGSSFSTCGQSQNIERTPVLVTSDIRPPPNVRVCGQTANRERVGFDFSFDFDSEEDVQFPKSEWEIAMCELSASGPQFPWWNCNAGCKGCSWCSY